MKLNNKLPILLACFIAITALFPIQKAKADSSLGDGEFIALPFENLAKTGYLNSSSTGFLINIQLNPDYAPESVSLFLDSCEDAIDTEQYDTQKKYILSSGTSSPDQLKDLLAKCSSAPDKIQGIHQVSVRSLNTEGEQALWQTSFNYDSVLPGGNFEIKNISGKKLLKVGDEIEVDYIPSEPDTLSVKASIYDRELTWQKIDNKFTSIYKVQEGDEDRVETIELTNVDIDDFALNNQSDLKLSLPIDFSIDANSPTVSIISPENRFYNVNNLLLEYKSSGYESIEVYLDGSPISNLNLENLSEGSHRIKIIATDLAGNSSVAEKTFDVDTVAPSGELINTPTTANENQSFDLIGKTEPGSSVLLEIGDQLLQTIADQTGNFSFQVNPLKSGQYRIYLTITDQSSNAKRFFAGNLEVKQAVSVITSQESKPEIKVALADSNEDEQSDVSKLPALKLPTIDSAELSNLGKLTAEAASDNRVPNNYQAWWILVSLIAVSIFLSAISYNLYSRFVAVKDFSSQREPVIEENISTNISQEKAAQPVEGKEEPPENPGLRW